jgi:hypothetical protein
VARPRTVVEGQSGRVADAQVRLDAGARRPLARDLDEPRGEADTGHPGAACGGGKQRVAGTARGVEDAVASLHVRGAHRNVGHGLELRGRALVGAGAPVGHSRH